MPGFLLAGRKVAVIIGCGEKVRFSIKHLKVTQQCVSITMCGSKVHSTHLTKIITGCFSINLC